MHFPRLRLKNAWHYLLVAFVCLLGLGTTNNLWLGNSFAINAIWEIGPCHAFKSHMKTLGKLRFSKLQQLSYSVFHGAGQLNMIYSIPNSVGWLHCLWSGVGLDRQTGVHCCPWTCWITSLDLIPGGEFGQSKWGNRKELGTSSECWWAPRPGHNEAC